MMLGDLCETSSMSEFKQAPFHCQEREVWLLNTWGLGRKSLLLLSWNEATARCENKKPILVSLNRAAFINFHLIYLRKFNYSVIFWCFLIQDGEQWGNGGGWGTCWDGSTVGRMNWFSYLCALLSLPALCTSSSRRSLRGEERTLL